MELREPPRTGPRRRSPVGGRWLAILAAAGLAIWSILLVWRPSPSTPRRESAERAREVAAKLQAAGALVEAAARYEAYLEAAAPPADQQARIAYSLGVNYLESGQYEKALRWFYESETLGGADLGSELSARIVHCLERLGRHRSAQAALESRVELSAVAPAPADDPFVARIGPTEVRRSELLRALDDLPPEIAAGYSTDEGRREFLEKWVADELLWRKAVKLEYDRDPEVQRRHAAALKQLAVARFLEREVMNEITVDEADLRNYFEANRQRYESGDAEDASRPEVTLEQVRPQVERDYRLLKLQSAYSDLIATELAAQQVELMSENLGDER